MIRAAIILSALLCGTLWADMIRIDHREGTTGNYAPVPLTTVPNYVLTFDINGNPVIGPGGGGTGTGVTDGDKGDVSVSASGATWTVDAGAITLAKLANLAQNKLIGRWTASTGVPEAITIGADFLTTSGTLSLAVAPQPLDADLTYLAGFTPSANVKSLLNAADYAAMRTLLDVQQLDADLTDLADGSLTGSKVAPFTGSVAGAVPVSLGGTTNFLRADGTWTQPPGTGGVGANVSYTFNSSTAEPPIGNQLRLNNASQTVATKLWVMVTTTDGLDVTIGLAKIKAGHQIYFQDRDNAAKWVKYAVTVDGIAKGGGVYYEFAIAYLAGPANVPTGTIQLQPVAPGTVGVSAGGTTGQALTKTSNADYDVGWSSVQPLDADLTTIAAQTTAALGATTALAANTTYTGAIATRTVTLPAAASSSNQFIRYAGTAAASTVITWPASTVRQVGSSGYTSSITFAAGNAEFSLWSDGTDWFLADSTGTAGSGMPVCYGVAASDETTAITTGTAKATFRVPHAMTLTAVRASVTTAPTGATILIDINEAGTTLISTKLMIDATEKTSTTATTAYVIADSALADDAEITIDFDQVGSTIAGAGVKVWLIGTR